MQIDKGCRPIRPGQDINAQCNVYVVVAILGLSVLLSGVLALTSFELVLSVSAAAATGVLLLLLGLRATFLEIGLLRARKGLE